MKNQEMKILIEKVKEGDVLKIRFSDSDLGGDLSIYLGNLLANEAIIFHGDDENILDHVANECNWGLSQRDYEIIVCERFDPSSFDNVIDHGLFESIEIC